MSISGQEILAGRARGMTCDQIVQILVAREVDKGYDATGKKVSPNAVEREVRDYCAAADRALASRESNHLPVEIIGGGGSGDLPGGDELPEIIDGDLLPDVTEGGVEKCCSCWWKYAAIGLGALSGYLLYKNKK